MWSGAGTCRGFMASSNLAERKGSIEKIKRVQVDGLVSQDPLQRAGLHHVLPSPPEGGAEGHQALSGGWQQHGAGERVPSGAGGGEHSGGHQLLPPA